MKLMKHITIALVLCAIPAMAFGQTVTCETCTHVVSVYMGNGGLIASVADDVEKVTYVATCGGVTRSGELTAAAGQVATLFSMDNGLACHTAGKTNGFKLGPIEDGGWYWITDEQSSAVGNLVADDILMNETIDITSAGDGVTMTAGEGAVFLKEASTGRVGILPNILPESPVDPLKKCGFKGAATVASPAVPEKTECALGDGGTILLMTTSNLISGASQRIMDKGTIARPASVGGEIRILADLWGNGSGHYVTTHDATTANGFSAMRGQPSVAGTAAGRGARLTGVSYELSYSTGGPGAGTSITSGTPAAGVDFVVDAAAATITVVADTAFCSRTANHSATVNVVALMATADDADQVTPSVARVATGANVGRVGSASFTVACPASSSADQGQELVPDNPFPVN